jgi:hypothetical protein
VDAVKRGERSRGLASFLASLGFVVLITGITYFAILVLSIRFGEVEQRATAYYELGKFLSGQLEWYKDARVYGAVSLLCALTSILFGVHRLARITLPVAGACFLVLAVFGPQIRDAIYRWADVVSRP